MCRPGLATSSTLSPNTLSVLGERARVRGSAAQIHRTHTSCLQGRNQPRSRRLGIGQLMPPLPTSPPNRLRRRAIQGRGVKPGGSSTQGGAQGSCLALALGYPLMPFQGGQEEAAASCRCTIEKISKWRASSLQ